MLSEGRVIIESDGLAQRGFDAGEDRQHDGDGLGGGLSGKSRGEGHAGFALMQNEHGPRALADDEVALPMTASSALGSGKGETEESILAGASGRRPSARQRFRQGRRRTHPCQNDYFKNCTAVTNELMEPLYPSALQLESLDS
jgi:hypothetical protein